MDNVINNIFSEALNWERLPINELIGRPLDDLSYDAKRVVLVGVTQTGKTTLILEIMGIDPRQHDSLEKILRGGTKAGRSSTSAPIVYDRWKEGTFGLCIKKKDGTEIEGLKRYEAEGFKNKIKEINDVNRSNADALRDLVYHYYLPDSYFIKNEGESVLQIVDLPGFDENNRLMSDVADRLIDEFSVFSAGNIVVVSAEKINSISKDYAKYVVNVDPSRLMVVITYAIEHNESLRKMLINDPALAADDIKKYYQDKTEGVSPLCIFPFQAKKGDVQNYPEHICNKADTLKRQICDRIEKMTVATTADICLREIRNSLATLQREKDSKSNELDVSTRELTVYREKKEGFDDIAKQLESEKNDIVKAQNKYNAGMSEIKNCIKKLGGYEVNADYLEIQFEDVGKNEAASHMYSYVHGLFADAIEKTRSKSCNDEQNQLKAYCCDDLAYFNFDFARPKLFKKYSGNWKKEVENKLPPIIKIITDSAVKRAEELAQVKTAEFDNKKIDVDGRIKSNITACGSLETKIKEYETRCEDIEKTLDEYTECIAKKQESAKNVKAVFVKHANGKLEEIGTRIFKEQDGRVQTALFLTACMIYGDLKKYYREDYE